AARPYYSRLTQALITAVSAPTAEGRLFEVDMRLRPSGRQGPVATAIQSFESYQMTEAWTWEHLALTRARVVAVAGEGAERLAEDIEALRLAVLRRRGTDPRVMPDLADMRERIFTAKPIDGRWEAKIGPGRLQDIDLLAQSLALRAGDPARGTLAQLRAGRRAGLIATADADRLASIWRLLWRLHASGRLLTAKPLNLDEIGLGGQEFLLRESGAGSIPELEERLRAACAESAGLIDAALTAEASVAPA
uniref:putative nucleotidyltransferase substrate binding domain-containing protein n=1 Tax=Paracoccus sp. TaxID=267 RepID=UPI0035AEABA1